MIFILTEKGAERFRGSSTECHWKLIELAPATALEALQNGWSIHYEGYTGWPACGHNACSQHFFETGSTECVVADNEAQL